MLISLIMVISSQCMFISKHPVVHLKHTVFVHGWGKRMQKTPRSLRLQALAFGCWVMDACDLLCFLEQSFDSTRKNIFILPKRKYRLKFEMHHGWPVFHFNIFCIYYWCVEGAWTFHALPMQVTKYFVELGSLPSYLYVGPRMEFKLPGLHDKIHCPQRHL